jgi:hypothetical protein
MTGVEGFAGLLTAIKHTGPLIFLAIAIASGIVLFAPVELATKLGLVEFRDANRSLLGAAFILSLSIALVNLLHKVSVQIGKRYRQHRNMKVRLKHLDQLTPEEKGYLAPYVLDDVNTQKFQLEDGIAMGLAAKDILYRPSSIFDFVEGAGFNIQPWAKNHLKANPELLEGRVMPRRRGRERI